MPESLKHSRSHIPSLTSLRFFAAFSIFIVHARNHNLLPDSFLSSFDLSQAVSFFFVLSGFVIAYAYIGRRFSILQFYRLRFARVWPAFLFSTIFAIVLVPRSLYLPASQSLSATILFGFLNLIGLQAWFPIPSVFFSFNAVCWSISVESFFYAIFPFLSRLTVRKIALILLCSSLVPLLFVLMCNIYRLPGFSASTLNSVVWEGFLYINPLARLPEFILGIIVCRCFLFLSSNNYFGIRNSLSSRYLPLISPFLGSISILLFSYLGFHSFNWSFNPFINYILTRWSSAINFALLIMAASSCQGLLCQFLRWPPLVFLGEISYGIYLYHQPLMIRAAQAGGFEFAGIQILQSSFFPLLGWTLLFSSISFYALEVPVYQFIKPKRANYNKA